MVGGTFYDMNRVQDGYFTISAPYGQVLSRLVLMHLLQTACQ